MNTIDNPWKTKWGGKKESQTWRKKRGETSECIPERCASSAHSSCWVWWRSSIEWRRKATWRSMRALSGARSCPWGCDRNFGIMIFSFFGGRGEDKKVVKRRSCSTIKSEVRMIFFGHKKGCKNMKKKNPFKLHMQSSLTLVSEVFPLRNQITGRLEIAKRKSCDWLECNN